MPPTPEPAASYTVVHPRPFTLPGGRPAGPGDELQLTAAQAEPLLARGRVVPNAPAAPAKPKRSAAGAAKATTTEPDPGPSTTTTEDQPA